MSDPRYYLGKIVKSLEKFYDVNTRRIQVKSRPSLIIGFEPNYTSILDIDFELLPISSLQNQTPDPIYDVLIDAPLFSQLGLTHKSYIRTHKIAWNHVKHIVLNQPIGDIKSDFPRLYNHILNLNQQWVNTRTQNNLVTVTNKSII